MADLNAGRSDVPLGARPLDTGLLAVARRGVDGLRARPGREPHLALPRRLAQLLEKVTPALVLAGDVDDVTTGFHRLARTGTGADRQRAMLAGSTSRRAFVSALADAAIPVV